MITRRDPGSQWDYKAASHRQRGWFDSFPPRSCTYLSSWGWEAVPISFPPHLGSDRFGVDNCKPRQQKAAVHCSAARRAKAAHGSPTTGFLFGTHQCSRVSGPVWWSCPHVTTAGKSAWERQGLPAAGHQGCTELGHFTHQKSLLLSLSLSSCLQPEAAQRVRRLCAGTPPKNQKTWTLQVCTFVPAWRAISYQIHSAIRHRQPELPQK